MELRKLWFVPAAAVALAGCAEEGGLLGPDRAGSGAERLQATLSCQVAVRSGEVMCSAPDGSIGGGASKAIIGDQGLHVQLESSNVSYDAGSSVFSAAVSIRNLLDQTLGSADGATRDGNGIRIFFVNAPVVTEGSGTVGVRNADGTADFTSAGQPYFQYDQALTPGARSLPKTWEWDVPGTVEKFTFLVGVDAKLANEASITPGLKFVAQRIAADTQHTCVLDLSGQAYCWGEGGSGRLGTDDTGDESAPAAVQGGITFATIVAGHSHTCGIATDGRGYCWGNGGNGRLGNGATSSQYTPGEIVGEYTWISLSASSSNTCGVTVDGEGYCWGFASTRLGNGISEQVTVPSRVLDPPEGPVTWAKIESAHLTTCGLTTDGVIYCWGPDGSNGRLGIGTLGDQFDRPTVPIASAEKFVDLSGKEQHFCALTEARDAYCWGLNVSGQLGIGTSGDTVPTPTKVVGGHKWAQIYASRSFTCGLTFAGDAYCWGTGSNGRLGNGVTSGVHSEPVPVNGGLKFQHLSAGHRHVCGITTTGEVYCWGAGESNQLGNGSTEDKSEPTYVPGLSNIAWHESLPAMRCGDGSQRASCFPARQSLESYALAGLIAVPRRVELPLSVSASLAGA